MGICSALGVPDASACASWAQAWGTVLAIGAAIAIASHQTRVARRERHETKVARLKTIEALLLKTNICAGILQTAGFDNATPETSRASADLKECADAIDRLPLFEVPDADLILQLTTLPRLIRDVSGGWLWAQGEAGQINTYQKAARETLPSNLRVVILSTVVAMEKCRAAAARY